MAGENRRILILDREPALGGSVADILREDGYQVVLARSAEEAGDHLERRRHDAAIVTLESEHGEPSRLVRRFRSLAPGTPLLVIADAERLREAVETLRHGADDYLVQPADSYEVRARLGRILERYDLDSKVTFLQDELSKKYGYKLPVQRSRAMRSLLERVMRVAPMRATVLIHGESGVGKELIARAIHFNSPRRDQPMIALNCAAIPASLIESELFGHERGSFTGAHTRLRGKFELAHRGTLFLDEIAEMDPATQAKLLRVLEEREFMRVGGDQSIRVDVRVIAATNADLETMVARSRIRRDLYYRLKVVTIHVPALRERRSDIPVLVETFLDELSRANAVPSKTITPEALAQLRDYPWPGNVRELKNVLESVLVSVPGDEIGVDDLPSSIRGRGPRVDRPELTPGTTLVEMEQELIRRTLQHTGGNRTHSASLLGIGVRTLQRKIRAYGIRIPSTRRRARRQERPAE